MPLGSIDSFYQRISRAIRRGKVYDEDIPGYAEDAVKQLEDSHDWKHMWTETTGAMVVGLNEINLTPVSTDAPIRNVRFISVVDTDGGEHPLKKTRRENVIGIEDGRPGAFWMKAQSLIGLDALPDEAYTYSIGYYRYSAFPLANTLGWLEFGKDVLMAHTIVNMHPVLRDDKLLQRWGKLVDKRVPELLQAQLDHLEDGIENKAVPFADEMAEDGVDLVEFV